MSVAHGSLIEALSNTGLVSSQDLTQAAAELGAGANQAQSLCHALVRQGKLTEYQAQAAIAGQVEGLVLNDYIVLEQIGSGGMGQVFKARHRLMDRVVALKAMQPGAADSPRLVQRFYREVKATAKLQHPNIVTAHDAFEHEGVCYLINEYVDGMDLGSVVRQRGRLAMLEAVNCVLQAARGLAYAHAHGVVHRDIKPANLLVDRRGIIKVMDMGLARLMEETALHEETSHAELPEGRDEPGLTLSGRLLGTAPYMAPEQFSEPHNADPRSDIYSLGCTLYRLLTGAPPFQGETPLQVAQAHRDQPVPRVSDTITDAPPALQTILDRMLAKKADGRYPSMNQLIVDLERLFPAAHGSRLMLNDAVEVSSLGEFTPATLIEPRTERRSRRVWVAGSVVISASVLAAAVGLVMLGDAKAPLPAEYDPIAQGNWVPVPPVRVIDGMPRGAALARGGDIVEVMGGAAMRVAEPEFRDGIIRARIRDLEGSSFALGLRDVATDGSWSFYALMLERQEGRAFARIYEKAASDSQPGIIMEQMIASPPAGEWFELAFCAVGPTLRGYINRVEVVRIDDMTGLEAGRVTLTLRTPGDRVQIKDVEWMSLDPADPPPP
jgi:serine/threonine protein kinase